MTGTVAGVSAKPKSGDEPGLPKRPVASLTLTAAGAGGDYNRYRTRTLHGDPDSAVLLLTEDILLSLRGEGWPVGAGDLGENVLLAGIGNDALAPGRRLRLGEALVEVTRACVPCSELYELPYVGADRGPRFLRTLQGRRGWYARVLGEGLVAPGDPARLLGS